MTAIARLSSFRGINNKVLKGFDLMDASNPREAVRVWYQAWEDILAIIDNTNINSIKEFERCFRGRMTAQQLVVLINENIEELEAEDPEYVHLRLALCESVLPRFEADLDYFTLPTLRDSLTDCYTVLGQPEKTIALYEDWLNREPTWAQGWVDWSDCYLFEDYTKRDPAQVANILREGISKCAPRDRYSLLKRLVEVFEYFEREDEAEATRKLLDLEPIPFERKRGSLLDQVTNGSFNFETQSHGRRASCTCGSSKKYKNCCDVKLAARYLSKPAVAQTSQMPATSRGPIEQSFANLKAAFEQLSMKPPDWVEQMILDPHATRDQIFENQRLSNDQTSANQRLSTKQIAVIPELSTEQIAVIPKLSTEQVPVNSPTLIEKVFIPQ